MKSSAMCRLCRCPQFGGTRGPAPPQPLVRDAREDEDAACDLERMEALPEQDNREEDREERLQVVEQSRARGADAVDRREPQDVREEERPDDCVAEAEPDLPPERERLVCELRRRERGKRHP